MIPPVLNQLEISYNFTLSLNIASFHYYRLYLTVTKKYFSTSVERKRQLKKIWMSLDRAIKTGHPTQPGSARDGLTT